MGSYDPRHLHDLNRDAIQVPLIKKALKDPAFRQQLIDDPRTAVSGQLGMELPPDVKITVLQESTDHFYITLPPPLPPVIDELRDEDLAAVAGGKASTTTTKTTSSGGCTCACSGTSSSSGSTLSCE
jgi:hypothetical protein